MSSRIVAAVPNSLLMNKSRSGSRSKSGKQRTEGGTIQQPQSNLAKKNMAGMKGITMYSGRDGASKPISHSINQGAGIGRTASLAMGSISSHNLVVNKSNDFSRRVSQSPYSFKTRINAPATVSQRIPSTHHYSIEIGVHEHSRQRQGTHLLPYQLVRESHPCLFLAVGPTKASKRQNAATKSYSPLRSKDFGRKRSKAETSSIK